MQDHCHIVVRGEKIKVLRRSMKNGCALFIRRKGSDGRFLEDESAYLANDQDENAQKTLRRLLDGKTVCI